MQIKIAILGGSGAEGSGLALRFARSGARVFIGSRSVEKAQAAAARIGAQAGAGEVTGHANADAVPEASIVILTVPLSAQIETLKAVRDRFAPGAILVDTTVPLEIAIGGRVSRTISLWDGSAAQQAARLAPEGVSVVATFHSLSAGALADLEKPLECDTLICGDSAEAKAKVSALAETISGVRAIDAGPLENSRFLENTAALLIALNLRHKVKHSGLRVTGLGMESGKGSVRG